MVAVNNIKLINSALQGEYQVEAEILDQVNANTKEQDGIIIQFMFLQKNTDGEMKVAGTTYGKSDKNYIYGYGGKAKLERGVYDVCYQEYDPAAGGTKGEIYHYDGKVMAGTPYTITVSMKDITTVNGRRGVYIKVRSHEIEIRDHELYYTVTDESDGIQEVKYYLPMNETRQGDFFVEGANKMNIEIIAEYSQKFRFISEF